MGVHVDEIHTNVVPPVAPVEMPREHPTPERLGLAESTWLEAQRAVAAMARRTAAEGFDD